MPERSPDTVELAWQKLFMSLGTPPLKGSMDALKVLQKLTFDSDNHNAIATCIATARENARQVREQISSEMWEQINRLYLNVGGTNARTIWNAQPHAFFQDVKQGAHLFQGISDSTMNRGQGWQFIQIGQFIERASNLAILLDVHLLDLAQVAADPTQDIYLDAVSLLRSCTAWEAYCKVYTADIQFNSIAECLLLNEEFPHSVNFALMMVRNALFFIVEAADTRKYSGVIRTVGRLKALLDYGHFDEIVRFGLHTFLRDVQNQCGHIHELLYKTFITYPVDEKLPA
jgi:uncharacterized alpha-E superfamily protein